MIRRIKKVLSASSFQNSYWSVLNVLSMPIIMLIATPLFINKLGAELYGIWMLINSIIAMFGVMNLGFSDATIKYISHYRAKKDEYHIYRIINNTFPFYFALSFLSVVATYLIAIAVDKYEIIQINKLFRGEIIATAKLASLIIGFKLIEQIFTAVFKGFERYDLSSKIQMCSKTSLILSQVAIVLLGGGLEDIFLGSTIVLMIATVIEFLFLKLRFKKIRFILIPELDTIKEVFSFGLWSWIYSLLGIIATQADKFIIAFFAGAKVLAFYSIAHLVSFQIHSIFAASTGWIFPKVSKEIRLGYNMTDLYYGMQLIIVATGMVGIALLFFSKDQVFLLWLGQNTFNDSIRFIELFLGITALNLITIVPYYFLNGGGFIKLNTSFKIWLICIDLLSMVIGFKLMGVTGLIYGRFVSPLIVSSINRSILHYKVLDEKNYLSGFKLTLPVLLLITTFYLDFDYYLINAIKGLMLFLSVFLIYKFYYTPVRSFNFLTKRDN